MGVIVRLLTPSAITVKKWAERLGQSVLRRGGGVANGILDGYMARAIGDKRTAVVTVVEPPGALVAFEAQFDARGQLYPAGTRDYIDSRIGKINGPFNYADITPAASSPVFVGLGFDPGFSDPLYPWSKATRWRSGGTSNREVLRYHTLRIDVPPYGAGYPFNSFDQVPVGTTVFSGVDVYRSSAKRPGYWWGEDAIHTHAPGYDLMCRTSLGYMSYQYQGMQPVSASHGDVTLMAIPVVKNLDPGEAVHWGASGLLFVLLNNRAVVDGNAASPVLWSRLWTPDEHSVDFFHNGPWKADPNDFTSSYYAAPQDSWDAFWSNWRVARPIPAGGSLPNWTDAISMCWFNNRFVVNLRCCALNGALADFGVGWDYSYITAGGSAHMRFEIPLAGGLTATEVQYEVWDSASSYPGRKRPFDVWVAGRLNTAVVHGVNPLATLLVGTSLVEVTWRMEASRSPIFFSGRGPFMPADMATARVEAKVTNVAADGAELPPVTRTVMFDALGAGIQGPTFMVSSTLVMGSPTMSYKLWPLTPMFTAISDHELAFVCYEAWGDFGPTAPVPVKMAVLDINTGTATVRSELGFSHDVKASHELVVHLSCAQEARYNVDGEITIEAVLFTAGDMTIPVRISRDSGRTWQDYLTFPRAKAGAYYIGNPLAAGKRPGAAIN